MGMGATPGELEGVLGEVRRLRGARDPPEAPHRSKYEAAALLEAWRRGAAGSSAEPEAAARADVALGQLKLDAEEPAEAEALLGRGVAVLAKSGTPALAAEVAGAFNSLGFLRCRRGDFAQAGADLEEALAAYHSAGGGGGEEAGDGAADEDREAAYTTTCFLLAQVHGQLGETAQSAHYCGVTLGRQLKSGEYAAHEWAQNAAQLAGTYLDLELFAHCEHLLAAASAVLAAGPGATHVPDAAPAGGDAGDVPANVQLAWGKFHATRLAGAAVGEEVVGEAAVSKELDFSASLVLPEPRFVGRPVTFPVADYAEAKRTFNVAMAHLRAALAHYRLDEWVTEHFNILMDASGLYKNLAEFEPDVHRRCVLHRLRARLLEPLLQALNPKVFKNLVQSVQLEAADAYSSILDIKLAAGRPAAKVRRAGERAAARFDGFLGEYLGADGSIGLCRLPEAVDEAVEFHVLCSCINLARVLQKVAGLEGGERAGERARLRRALALLAGVRRYWERPANAGRVMKEGSLLRLEKPIVEEMCLLMADKLRLLEAAP